MAQGPYELKPFNCEKKKVTAEHQKHCRTKACGKGLHNYGQSPLLQGKLTNFRLGNGFNRYSNRQSLPEGICTGKIKIIHHPELRPFGDNLPQINHDSTGCQPHDRSCVVVELNRQSGI